MSDDILSQASRVREEIVYKKLFPAIKSEFFVPQKAKLVAFGGKELIEVGWGVFQIEPTEKNPHWIYLTSGLSNPFDDEEFEDYEESGYGFELAMYTQKKSPWAISVLWNLMGYVLTTGNIFADGHVMPLNGPIDGEKSALKSLIFYDDRTFSLPTGSFTLLTALGITEEESDLLRTYPPADLKKKLEGKNIFPLTVAERS